MPKTYYLDNIVINAALRNTAWVPPVIVYVALYTASPNQSGGGTEVTGSGYGRQPCTFGSPTNGSASNVADITFPIALDSWGTVTSFGLCDTSSGGNILYYGNLSAPRLIETNDQMRLPAGQLICSEQ
jgi:hypothetical protein